MRKIIFTILLVSVGLNTNAQIKKGSTLIGGQVSIYSEEVENEDFPYEYKNNLINVSIGRAIKENTVIGIGFGYSWYNNYYESDSSATESQHYDIGAYLRKYKNIGKDFYFFGQIDGAYITGTGNMNSPDPDYYRHSTTSGGRASVSLGLAYNIFKKMQVELSIPNILGARYIVINDETNDPTRNSKTKKFSFNSNLTNNTVLGSLAIGFRFVL